MAAHLGQRSQRLVSRAFLGVTVLVIGVSMVVGAVVLLISLAKGPTGGGGYMFTVRYVAPASSVESGTMPLRATKGEALVQYDSVTVTTAEPLAESIQLTRLAIVAPFVVFFLACALVLILVRRVWTGQSFSRPAAGGLAALAILVIGVAKFVPWLRLRAVEVAVDALGLPLAPSGAAPGPDQGWVVPAPYGLESIDWPMVVLGVVLFLLAVLLYRGTTLQDDLAGLV